MIRRKLLAWLGALPIGATCAQTDDAYDKLKRKFRGIGGVVVGLDVAAGAKVRDWIAIYADTGRQIAAPSRLGPKGNQVLAFTGGVLPVPRTVRVTWREGEAAQDDVQGWVGGTIVGDYTIEVASRIPDDVLDYVRAGRGRALRLKFRLKDDGVLFGWDVQETYTTQYGTGLRHKLPGGDFQDAHY